MNWKNRRTLRWLLALLLLSSTPLIAAQGTDTITLPKNGHSQISINACLSTCAHTVDQVKTMCNERQSLTPTSTLSLETCEGDCSAEIHDETHRLESKCDEAVTTAIAEERRVTGPIVSGLTAERNEYKQDAEDALASATLWRHVGFAGIGAAAGCLGAAVADVDLGTALLLCLGGAGVGFVVSM